MNVIRTYAITAAAITLSMVAATASAAIFIDFEDADVNASFLPTSYHGFTWSGGFGSGSWVVDLEGYDTFGGTEAHSQDHYVWSNGGTDLSISGGTFTLNSMWARIAQPSGTAIAHGFLGSTELFNQTLALTGSYQLFNLNFTGIDSWTLTDQENNVLIDDITLNGDAAATPEPASLAIWGLSTTGGLGLALVKCRRAAARNC